MSEKLDYENIGFMAGLEIHQQLSGTKLFCSCPAHIREDTPHFSLHRMLRASAGESGETDAAAAAEQMKEKVFEYQGYQDTTCLVEMDEEPVSHPSFEAVKTAVMVADMMDMVRVDKVHVMRKTVVDGSNTSGFQRTMFVSMNGKLEAKRLGIEADVRLDRLCLEEDSCKIITRSATSDVYNLTRLGIPLLEITTKPDIKNPQHLQDTASAIGMILRSTGRVKRGLGTIRQDVNVSIKGGNRVEIKGVQDLQTMPLLAENEVRRQLALLKLQKKNTTFSATPRDVSVAFKGAKGWIPGALKTGKAIGTTLANQQALLGKELYKEFRLGTELAGFAKVHGFGGIIHDAEDPKKYGLKDWSEVRTLLGAKKTDGFMIVIGEKNAAIRVLTLLATRLKALHNGVPSEVRKANPDGTTSYLRPMPGAARMYPETDVKVFSVKNMSVTLPKLLTERIAKISTRYNLHKSLAKELIDTDRVELFEQYAATIEPSKVADILVVREKDILKRNNIRVRIDEIAKELLNALSADSISASSVDDILIEHAKTGTIDWEKYKPVDTEAVRKVVQEVIKADKKAPFGALMGQAMKKLGGKADGKVVSKLLTEELGK